MTKDSYNKLNLHRKREADELAICDGHLENLQDFTRGDCHVKLIRAYIGVRLKEIELEAQAVTEQETQLTTLQKKHDELRGLVKNLLDEEAKDNPLHPVQNNDGFCPLYTPLAKAINWMPPVMETKAVLNSPSPTSNNTRRL